MQNPSIKCHVDTCRYNTQMNCSLNNITVGNTSSDACAKEETECDSFELK